MLALTGDFNGDGFDDLILSVQNVAITSSDDQIVATCAPYTATNTDTDTINYSECIFQVCPSSSGSGFRPVDIDGSNCVDDTYIALYDMYGNLIAENDDGYDVVGSCSQITANLLICSECVNYTIHEGCYEDTACGGTLVVTQTLTLPPSAIYVLYGLYDTSSSYDGPILNIDLSQGVTSDVGFELVWDNTPGVISVRFVVVASVVLDVLNEIYCF